MLDVGRWLCSLAIRSYWLRFVGCSLLVVGGWLFVVDSVEGGYWLLVGCC